MSLSLEGVRSLTFLILFIFLPIVFLSFRPSLELDLSLLLLTLRSSLLSLLASSVISAYFSIAFRGVSFFASSP